MPRESLSGPLLISHPSVFICSLSVCGRCVLLLEANPINISMTLPSCRVCLTTLHHRRVGNPLNSPPCCLENFFGGGISIWGCSDPSGKKFSFSVSHLDLTAPSLSYSTN